MKRRSTTIRHTSSWIGGLTVHKSKSNREMYDNRLPFVVRDVLGGIPFAH